MSSRKSGDDDTPEGAAKQKEFVDLTWAIQSTYRSFVAEMVNYSVEAWGAFCRDFPSAVRDQIEDEQLAANYLAKWISAGGCLAETSKLFDSKLDRYFGKKYDQARVTKRTELALGELADCIKENRRLGLYLRVFDGHEIFNALMELSAMLEWPFIKGADLPQKGARKNAPIGGRLPEEHTVIAKVSWTHFFSEGYPIAKAARVICKAIAIIDRDNEFTRDVPVQSVRVAIQQTKRDQDQMKKHRALSTWGDRSKM